MERVRDRSPRIGLQLFRGVGIALAVVCLATAALSMSATANPGPRTKLVLYPYHGIGGADSTALAADLEVYLTDKLRILYANFATNPVAAYMADLRIEKVGAKPATAAQLHNEWQRRGALLLMDGVIAPSNGTNIAKSSIYLGDLGRTAPGHSTELIHVDLPLRGEEYGSIADSHSVAALYGLALDARDSGLAKDFYVKVAARALELVDTLSTGPAVAPDLKHLRCGLLALIGEATGTPIMDPGC